MQSEKIDATLHQGDDLEIKIEEEGENAVISVKKDNGTTSQYLLEQKSSKARNHEPTAEDTFANLYKEVIRNPFRLPIIAFIIGLFALEVIDGSQAELLLAALFGAVLASLFNSVTDMLYLGWSKIMDKTVRRLPDEMIFATYVAAAPLVVIATIALLFGEIEWSPLFIISLLVIVFVRLYDLIVNLRGS